MRPARSFVTWIALFVGVAVLPAAAQRNGSARGVYYAHRHHAADNAPEDTELSPLQTQILGQKDWFSGGPAGLRVVVTNHQNGRPIPAEVVLTLKSIVKGQPAGEPIPLFAGRTNNLGTLDASFVAPDKTPGPYQLEVEVKSALGQDRAQQPIQLQRATQMMLTSDKPIYQPGQTMHLRVLALDKATHHSDADKPVVFEIEDARGNKVFKQKGTLSRFGIAGVDFVLADEVNMGEFTLRAILPDGQVEKKVRVERYVLPKFKIDVTMDKPYYLPGEEVKGVVKARYFFGKPVADGQVTVTLNTIDIGVTKLTEFKEKTDPIGTYTFHYKLPDSFVGQPFEQGKAVLGVDVALKDTADQKQEAHITTPVVKDPIQLVAVPESKTPVPGVDNRVYLAAATPDGAPLKHIRLTASASAEGNGAVKTTQSTLTTDDYGLAEFSYRPNAGEAVNLKITAVDAAGHSATLTDKLQSATGADGLILRTDRSLARVGERLNLIGLCAAKSGTLYLDVIRNRQTILTHSDTIKNGRAEISLPLTADMTGTLELHAYRILPDENIVRDTRIVVVAPADDLNIKVAANSAEYRPGGDASFTFTVQDQQHHPVSAALGVAMVDESVFALSELQPGLERIVFMLEKELMEPRYEIHGLSPKQLLLPAPSPIRDSDRQRAAAMIFASTPLRADEAQVNGGMPGAGFGRGVRGGGFGGGFMARQPGQDGMVVTDNYFDYSIDTWQTRWVAYRQKIDEEMVKAQQKILDALQRYTRETHTTLTEAEGLMTLVDKGYLKERDLLDHWGHFFKTNLYGQTNYGSYFGLSSAGPDGKWSTADDIQDASVYRRYQFGLPAGAAGGAFGGGGFGGFRGEAGDRPDINRRLREEPERIVNGAVRMLGGRAGGEALGLDTSSVRDELKSSHSLMSPIGSKRDASESGPRIRSYFPETMYWNPGLITDEEGRAELRIPMADSITTWRMSLTANSVLGQLGSATAPVKVFQDFFVDIDLPIALTQGDRMDLPVTVYNYLPAAQEVALTLDQQPWFALQGSPRQTIRIEPQQVKVVYYTITVNQIGHHSLTVTARGSKLSDAVRRTIEVEPDGKEIRTAISDRLEGKVEKSVEIPADAIPGASTIWVKLYPGTFSQVADGLDGMLQMPGGCFEQTSSSTYPDVLILDYLNQTKKINPEIRMRAEQYINIGYQRLVTFECKSGGFSWFGNEPAHQILTAYGLLEFGDMSRVHDVDPALISRTQQWLAGRQQADGSWEEKGSGIAEGIINRQTGALRSTAYVAWALAESGYQGPELAKGVEYVKAHLSESKDPYTLAVILNLLAKVERDGSETARVAGMLIEMAKSSDKAAWWESGTVTFTGADRQGADLETTGLAAYGLAKWGRNIGFTNKVLTYLVQSKDSFGAWSTTQATVWSMKALLYSSRNGSGGRGSILVLANGQKAGAISITPDNSDVMQQVDLGKLTRGGANTISLQFEGEGAPMFQIVGRYYLPWSRVPVPQIAAQTLSIDVAYDKKTLARDDIATVTTTIHNNTGQIAEMPLIDLGVPPGFTVDPDALDAAVKAGTISKYTLAARQVIVYLTKLDPNQTITLSYQVKARFPIKARTPLSKAYPYYNPERIALSAPQEIIVER